MFDINHYVTPIIKSLSRLSHFITLPELDFLLYSERIWRVSRHEKRGYVLLATLFEGRLSSFIFLYAFIIARTHKRYEKSHPSS